MMAKRSHLFPFRTQQLSSLAPMVLGGQPPGRVGRRWFHRTYHESENVLPALVGDEFVPR